MIAEADEGRSEFTIDMFENQVRNKNGVWEKAPTQFTDVDGNVANTDDAKLPEKWEWTGDWSTNTNRACDEEGLFPIFKNHIFTFLGKCVHSFHWSHCTLVNAYIHFTGHTVTL